MKAFPHTKMERGANGSTWYMAEISYEGMDLRDYFAAKAMQGIIGVVKGCELGRDGSTIMPDSIRLANVAYGIADAMMEARNESK